MNCKQCNQPLAENELFCKNCGHQGPLTEQQLKVVDLKKKADNTLLAQCKSVLFLIITICFTVMTIAQLIAMISGGVTGILGGILPMIIMIVATVNLWKSYACKDKASLVTPIKKASAFDQYMNIM